MKRRKKFSIRIRHRANLMFDAHFHTPLEQMVTSVVLLLLLGVFSYPIFREGPGFFFWILLCVMLIILLSLIMDMYFVVLKYLRSLKKRREDVES